MTPFSQTLSPLTEAQLARVIEDARLDMTKDADYAISELDTDGQTRYFIAGWQDGQVGAFVVECVDAEGQAALLATYVADLTAASSGADDERFVRQQATACALRAAGARRAQAEADRAGAMADIAQLAATARADGVPLAQIASHAGVTRQTVYSLLSPRDG